ncbi:MAG TPA: anti-sigma factor [Ilumatobacter sp.]|nr:anti-sigma factor [Ilumatobacter sp.]
MTEVDIHDLAAAYALDALDPAERAAYEAHFTTCAACRGDVAELRETAAQLGGLTAATPPADLKSRVLAEVATTRQLAPRTASVVPLVPRRRGRVLAAVATVAAAVVLVMAAALVVGRGGNEFNDQLAAMLADPSARMVELDGAGAGSVRLVWDGARVAVVGIGLADPGSGQRYELWMVDSDGAHPMQLLDRADGGQVQRVLDAPGHAVAWGVTLEPVAGSPTPTEPMLFHADVSGSA